MSLRVLIADDSSQVRLLLSTIVRRRGYTVLEAVDGHQALALLREQRPDLAILDFIMPGLDALEVCRAARGEPSLQDTRIVIISASDGRAQALDAGADRFLAKPFLPVDLLAMIDDVMTPPPG